MPKIDIDAMEWQGGSRYPALFAAVVKGRTRKQLGDEVGIDQFGVNITRLDPGSASAIRHWHEQEDEFVFILQGEATLVDDDGESILYPGDAAGFKAGVPNGHHLLNKSDGEVVYLEIGTRSLTEKAHYPDDDLAAVKDASGFKFTHKSGDPYS